MQSITKESQDVVKRLIDTVLQPMKSRFVGKGEIIDLLGVCLIARENLFLYGPPGTAKSALVQDMAKRIDGEVFDYLLTRFTEPNEVFGPFDIRQLREGNLVTNTEGMLPEATFVFLDELLNANSAILNSLLMVLNERVFRRGRETLSLPTLMVVGASNHLPEDDALQALFDRFLLRVNCTNVPNESLGEVLAAGWKIETSQPLMPEVTAQEISLLQQEVQKVDVSTIGGDYVNTINRLRDAGIEVSDRRAVKLQRLLAASAVISGRAALDPSDMWVLRYIWDNVQQQEVLASLVSQAIESAEQTDVKKHEQALRNLPPDADALARDLQNCHDALSNEIDEGEVKRIREKLAILSDRISWVSNEVQRRALTEQMADVLETATAKGAGSG